MKKRAIESNSTVTAPSPLLLNIKYLSTLIPFTNAWSLAFDAFAIQVFMQMLLKCCESLCLGQLLGQPAPGFNHPRVVKILPQIPSKSLTLTVNLTS